MNIKGEKTAREITCNHQERKKCQRKNMWSSREEKMPYKKNMWSSRLVIPDPSLTGLESRVRELEQVVAEKVGLNTVKFSIFNCRNVSFAKMQCIHTKVWLLYRWGLLVPDNVHDLMISHVFYILFQNQDWNWLFSGEDYPRAKEDDRGTARTNSNASQSSAQVEGVPFYFFFARIMLTQNISRVAERSGIL